MGARGRLHNCTRLGAAWGHELLDRGRSKHPALELHLELHAALVPIESGPNQLFAEHSRSLYCALSGMLR